jgi:hypothetical protein
MGDTGFNENFDYEKEIEPNIKTSPMDEGTKLAFGLLTQSLADTKTEMKEIRRDIKELYTKIDLFSKELHEPFRIMQEQDQKRREQDSRIDELIKTICPPSRQKACEEKSNKEIKKKKFIEKYRTTLILSTTVVVTLIISRTFEVFWRWFSHFLGGTP